VDDTYSPEGFERMTFGTALGKRALFLIGEIDAGDAKRICASVAYLNLLSVEPITFYIDSPGGSASAGLDIYDAVKSSKSPVTGIVMRRASSAAAIVLQACAVRKIHRNSDIMMHHPSPDSSLGTLDVIENAALRKEYLRNARHIFSYVCTELEQRLHKSRKDVVALFGSGKDGRTYSAARALKEGLVDEIIG
jgi:ATP-dependent Clp endopeptidase proteolytic subunit ClpP